ncbi:MAG: hypothetical protein GXP62_11040, partial [Oligoflexia bacterium]|nr:hypothetical protein [Oligoflexia bacterium]
QAGAAQTDSAGPDAAELLTGFIELCESVAVPLEQALTLVRGLDRKFPAARGPDLLAACQELFPAWGAFDDWMGAVSLLRAVPTQRTLGVLAFARSVRDWLAGQDDLFDALADFSRLEANGQRPVAEVLELLGQGGAA